MLTVTSKLVAGSILQLELFANLLSLSLFSSRDYVINQEPYVKIDGKSFLRYSPWPALGDCFHF